MSQSAEAAEQIVNAATNVTIMQIDDFIRISISFIMCSFPYPRSYNISFLHPSATCAFSDKHRSSLLHPHNQRNHHSDHSGVPVSLMPQVRYLHPLLVRH